MGGSSETHRLEGESPPPPPHSAASTERERESRVGEIQSSEDGQGGEYRVGKIHEGWLYTIQLCGSSLVRREL